MGDIFTPVLSGKLLRDAKCIRREQNMSLKTMRDLVFISLLLLLVMRRSWTLVTEERGIVTSSKGPARRSWGQEHFCGVQRSLRQAGILQSKEATSQDLLRNVRFMGD